MISQRALTNHIKTKHFDGSRNAKVFQCGHCSVGFTQVKNLLRHLRSQHHLNGHYRCSSCPTFFGCSTSLNDHENDHEMAISSRPRVAEESSVVEFTTRALNSRFQIHRVETGNASFIDPFNCLISLKDNILRFVNSLLNSTASVKIGFSISVGLVKPIVEESTEAYFNSNMVRLAVEMTEEEYMEHVDQLISQLNVFATGGSGWVVEKLMRFELKTAKCASAVGGSYIETPAILQKVSRSLLNIINKRDNLCFIYCVAAALFSFVGRPFRPKTHLKNVQKLKFNASEMPMPLSGIRSFELRNKCKIYVYQLDGNKLVNVYNSKNKKFKRRVDLLRLIEGKKRHYCLIRNFSNIIHHLSRSPKKQAKGPKSRFCRNCYQPVLKQNMEKHLKFCESNASLEIRMPDKERVIEFTNWQKTQLNPFIVYADLEAINVPSIGSIGCKLKTREVERQYPASYGAILVDAKGL